MLYTRYNDKEVEKLQLSPEIKDVGLFVLIPTVLWFSILAVLL